MTIAIRTVPKAAKAKVAVPFKIIVPRQLEIDDAMEVYKRLREQPYIKLQDPFFLPQISSVFPGVIYVSRVSRSRSHQETGLGFVASFLEDIGAEYLEDTFIELDVPDALEDEVEALDVQDLSGTGQ